MTRLLAFMAKCKIEQAAPAKKGSQLKMSFILEGGQKAVFRPMRYERGHVIEERGNKGADRHNGEIAAFHLARVLGMSCCCYCCCCCFQQISNFSLLQTIKQTNR